MLLSYWRQVTRTRIIHNSRSWHKRGQEGVDGKRKPARRAQYNSNSSTRVLVCFSLRLPVSLSVCSFFTLYLDLVV